MRSVQSEAPCQRVAPVGRRVVHEGDVAQVVEIWTHVDAPPPSGVIERYAVVLPYEGLFGFRAGPGSGLFDAQRALFVTAGQEYADSHPVEGIGHAALVIRPSDEVLEELFGSDRPSSHTAFRRLGLPMSARARMRTQRLRRLGRGGVNRLRDDERILATLREFLPERSVPLNGCSRIVERAREVLHGLGFERVSLDRIAREVGVSPNYLTQAFTRAEGQPLYRYQLGLRLNRALVELPHSDDITALALDLGFSSHAHFSTAFKASFGQSPSEYRAEARLAA